MDYKKPWATITKTDFPKMSYPSFNFIVMDHLGNLESHQLMNPHILKHNYRLKLPKTGSYFLFADRGEVYVIKGRGYNVFGKNKKMKITKLSSTGNHRTIPDSKMPASLTQGIAGSFRLGNLFWVFASQQNEAYANFGNLFSPSDSRSLVWSIKKQKWFRLVSLLSYDKAFWWDNPCGMSLNQTFGLIISTVRQDNWSEYDNLGWIPSGCVGFQLVDYATSHITRNNCFQMLENFVEADEISCTSFISKDGSMFVTQSKKV